MHLVSAINLKLALLGCPPVADPAGAALAEVVGPLVEQYREKERLLQSYLCPADQRIQTFLYDYFQEIPINRLPLRTFTLDRPGLARVLSLPIDRDEYVSELESS